MENFFISRLIKAERWTRPLVWSILDLLGVNETSRDFEQRGKSVRNTNFSVISLKMLPDISLALLAPC